MDTKEIIKAEIASLTNEGADPTKEQVKELIEGTNWVIKNVF